MRKNVFWALLFMALFLSGCAGSVKNMKAISDDMAVTAPAQDKALVVFMRPSSYGYAIQSSVFEIQNKKPSLVGIVASKKKVSYQVDPGKRLFMVVGESADFMSADLLPGKTYYANVVARMGVWKARFSLKPIHNKGLQTEKFKKWLNDCNWVELSPISDTWAKKNITDIQKKYNKYYPKWMEKDVSARPALLPADGK
ncbi:MAG: hypothetical protein GY705_18850 [Bacteroidetes bacterium]|nr:hypothetical protein [Bacteroidota bacterium]